MAIYLDLKSASYEAVLAEKKRLEEYCEELKEEKKEINLINDVSLFVIFFDPLTALIPPLLPLKPIIGGISLTKKVALFVFNCIGEQIYQKNKRDASESLCKINEELELRNRPWYMITLEKIKTSWRW